MSQTTTQLSFTREGFDAFLESREEPDWLRQQRQEAWRLFEQCDWPSSRAEEWMRTDIRLFKLNQFPIPLDGAAAERPAPAAMLTEGVELAGQTVSLNSQVLQSRLNPKWSDRGVLFGSLDQLVRSHGDLIRPHLMRRAVRADIDKFSALHAACWAGGSLLYVPRGVVVDQPLHALAALSDGGSDLSHVLVILEDGAEATFISETASTDPEAGGFHCGATEIIVGAGANLRLVSMQNWSHHVWHFAHQKALIGQDASLQWTIAALGSRLAKVNQHVSLVGRGANTQVNGVMFTEGRQHLSYHTLQHHEAPNCRSDFLYKASLQDKSRTVWRGMIRVDEGAQKTDGYQRNDNLLLSPQARADSIPGLEIEADDVRCTHGSTSGRVDEEQIFYLRCRGFTRKEAMRIIVSGFFQQVFDRITIENVREALAHAIGRRVREYD